MSREEHMKMRRSTKLVAAAAAVVALALGGVALAQPEWGEHRGMWGGHRGMRGEGIPFAQLNLSDDQQQEIRRIMDQHRTERQAVMQRLREARRAQADAVQAVPADEAAIRARSAEVAKAETDAALLRAKVHTEIFNVLTPDQQTKAKELRAERAKRRQQWHNQRQDAPPPPQAAPPQPQQ
jgi:Spy/CpxP family protein refolding chaperone